MFKKIRIFLREIKTELLDKTTWPTKDVVLSSTIVVIVSIVVVSVFLFLVDFGVSRLVRMFLIEKVSEFRPFFNTATFFAFIVISFFLTVLFYRFKKRIG